VSLRAATVKQDVPSEGKKRRQKRCVGTEFQLANTDVVLYQCISVDAFLQHCYQGLSLCHIGIGLQIKNNKKILLFSPSVQPIRNYSCVERERLYPACERRKENREGIKRREDTFVCSVGESTLKLLKRHS